MKRYSHEILCCKTSQYLLPIFFLHIISAGLRYSISELLVHRRKFSTFMPRHVSSSIRIEFTLVQSFYFSGLLWDWMVVMVQWLYVISPSSFVLLFFKDFFGFLLCCLRQSKYFFFALHSPYIIVVILKGKILLLDNFHLLRLVQRVLLRIEIREFVIIDNWLNADVSYVL